MEKFAPRSKFSHLMLDFHSAENYLRNSKTAFYALRKQGRAGFF